MSDSLIAFQPAMDEPSNMKPSVSMSSSITAEAMVKCCHLPLGSVKRRSTQSISSSLIRDRMVPGLFDMADALALLLFVVPEETGTWTWSSPTRRLIPAFRGDDERSDSRSEEHTSELQSR